MRSGLFPTPYLIPGPAHTLLRGLLFLFAISANAETLVLVLAGGWENPYAPWSITRRVTNRLELTYPNVRFETFGNHDLKAARKLIFQTIDQDHDGKLSKAERDNAQFILYGQSLGGSATIGLCRWLKKQQVPVRLTVQIDSVGLRDGKIPNNVREAANLYPHDFGPIRGQSTIRPEDPKRKRILGNWRYTYPKDRILDTSDMPLAHRLVLNPHLKMEFDPEVIAKVEDLIEAALKP